MKTTGILGGDVSKGMSNFVLLNMEGEELEQNFQLDDNKEGHQLLKSLVLGWMKKHELSRLVAGVESTGGYENNWYRSLKEIPGVDVLRINPRPVYHQGKAEKRQSTTDSVSASLVASYLVKNIKELNFSKWEPSREILSGRQLNRYIHTITKQQTRRKNALEKLLYDNMPELLSMKTDKYPNWYLEMLIRYPSRALILKAGKEELAKIPFLSRKKSEQIIYLLQKSIGGTSTKSLELTIGGLAEDIQWGKQKLKRLGQAQYEEVSKIMGEELDIAVSLDGIGTNTASTLLLEIGNVNRFPEASSLVTFWGINPTMKQSGDRTYRSKISKHGSPIARAALYMGAMNVVTRVPLFKQIYAKQRARGKKHNQAMVVVMAKLTRVLYGMLKSKKPFEAKIDLDNQNKKPLLEDNGEANRKKVERRYQSEKAPAPVSKRQRRKRKTMSTKHQNINNLPDSQSEVVTSKTMEIPQRLSQSMTSKDTSTDAVRYKEQHNILKTEVNASS